MSCFSADDPNLAKLLEPEAHETLEVLEQLKWVAHGIVNDLLLDNVPRANHYYDLSIIVGRGQEKDYTRLERYLKAVDTILATMATTTPHEVMQARDLVHTLVAPLPPKWEDEVLPVARKGRLVFFRL